MKKSKDKNLTVEAAIAKLDKFLIEKGLQTTIPGHKEGNFVRITIKPKK